jgi:hypothetical protein
MGRRTSGQTTGLQSIGNVQASAATLSTSQTNQNLTIAPNGSGTVSVSSSTAITGDLTIANQGDLRLSEASGNGTNYIAMQAAASMAANYTLTWPAAVTGTAGFVLTSDLSGNLSWASSAAGIPVSDSGSTATVHYPLFATNAGSVPTTLTPLARSNLSFVPSTGQLISTIGSFVNVIGDTANSGTITIRGTSSATKAAASVLMTDNVSASGTTSGTLVVTGGVGVSGTIHAGNVTTTGTVTAGTITETSSIALKENLNPITDGLNKILQLTSYTYDRKDGSSNNEAGLIAEKVYKVLPNLVTLDKDGKPFGVQYSKLTAYLIDAVKSLKEEVDYLKGNKENKGKE